MYVKVYFRGLGWYSGRMKGDTLIYNPGKEEDPEHPNIYLVSKIGAYTKVSKALDIELEFISVY